MLIFIVFNKNVNYEINKLYSEKDIEGFYDDKKVNFEEDDYISRENAIYKAINVFKNGFNIELDRNKFSENIRLYNMNDEFEWIIMWQDEELTYYCSINVSNSDITSIGYFKNTLDKYHEIYKVEDDNIEKIIEPLINELGLTYTKYFLFANKVQINENNEYMHTFVIDFYEKKVTNYLKDKINTSSIGN
jgi:hypothetical protein